jgi:hypothetical protein
VVAEAERRRGDSDRDRRGRLRWFAFAARGQREGRRGPDESSDAALAAGLRLRASLIDRQLLRIANAEAQPDVARLLQHLCVRVEPLDNGRRCRLDRRRKRNDRGSAGGVMGNDQARTGLAGARASKPISTEQRAFAASRSGHPLVSETGGRRRFSGSAAATHRSPYWQS